MSIKSFVTSAIGAVIGGTVVWVAQNWHFNLVPGELSYTDLAAVLLTAVAVIVAIFGGVFALAAIWGFNQLKLDAVAGAEKAGSREVQQQINSGTIRDYIKQEVERLSDEEFRSERMDERINRRVDGVIFGRPEADRLLEEDGEN